MESVEWIRLSRRSKYHAVGVDGTLCGHPSIGLTRNPEWHRACMRCLEILEKRNVKKRQSTPMSVRVRQLQEKKRKSNVGRAGEAK